MLYTKIFREILKKRKLNLFTIHKDKRKKYVRYKILFYGHKPTEIDRVSITSRFSVHTNGRLSSKIVRLDSSYGIRQVSVRCRCCGIGFTLKRLYCIIIEIYN